MPAGKRKFDVYIPLHEFHWSGNDLEVAPGIHIQKLATAPDLTPFKLGLTPLELRNLPDEVSHWLVFETSEGAEPSGALANLFLLALWLARPTRTHIAFRFEIGKEAAETYTTMARLYDRFEYVKGSTDAKFNDADLVKASAMFQQLLTIQSDTRLFMAQIITLNACWQFHWHAAIVLFASATETLLTYSEAPGLTKRLAVAYACLLHTAKRDRDAAFSDFRECYKTRSDVVHGRGLNIPKADRLAKVVRWQSLLRSLWVHVLQNPSLILILNGDDAHREAYIAPVVRGYSPPP